MGPQLILDRGAGSVVQLQGLFVLIVTACSGGFLTFHFPAAISRIDSAQWLVFPDAQIPSSMQ